MNITGFVPVKMNSIRVPAKSLRYLNGVRLVNYPIRTLNEVSRISEVVVFCSDESIKEYIDPGLPYRFVKRTEWSNTAREPEFFDEFIEKVSPEWIVGLWPTTPFIVPGTIDAMLDVLDLGRHDSAHTVVDVDGRCWFGGKPLNCDPVRHTHSGELEPVYKEAGDCKILPARMQTTEGRRIGENPYRHQIDLIEGWDINTEWDWCWAEHLARGPLDAKLLS